MLRQSEIRSVPIYNDAYIAIANRTGNVADLRSCRRRIRIGHSLGYFVYAFWPRSQRCYRVHAAEPASCVDVRSDPEDVPAEYTDVILGTISPSEQLTKHARLRFSQPSPVILFVSVSPGPHWKMQRLRAADCA